MAEKIGMEVLGARAVGDVVCVTVAGRLSSTIPMSAMRNELERLLHALSKTDYVRGSGGTDGGFPYDFPIVFGE